MIRRLSEQLRRLKECEERGTRPPTLVLDQEDIAHARRGWTRAVLAGEHRLYDFVTLLAWRLLGTRNIQLVARVLCSSRDEPEAHRIVIEETISRSNLKRYTDHSLAARIARRYRYRPSHRRPYGKLMHRASFLEYRPLEAVKTAPATRVLSRVKVDDQIWNKVCDALFSVDELVARDKILNPLSKYIKDVFGIKVLTTGHEQSYAVAEMLSTIDFTPDELETLGLPESTEHTVALIERKDYLSLPEKHRKHTGWEALKNVYRWGDQIFEMQIQTEANYHLETSDLSNTSHHTFDMRRQDLRRKLDKVIPHYQEFRTVLKILFKPQYSRRRARLPDWVRIDG